MPSPTRTVLLAVIVLLLADTVSAYLRQIDSVVEPHTQAQPVDTDGKPVHSVRFLSVSGASGKTNSALEERGFSDIIAAISTKLGMKAAKSMGQGPHQVLQDLVRTRNQLNEKTMVPWLEYVRMYRIKKGDHWASDRAVVEWLSKYMKTEEMTALFKSLEKNPKVMDMVENLQAALIKKGLSDFFNLHKTTTEIVESFHQPSSRFLMDAATTKTGARTVERVKVFCRLRPLIQRERDGWSYEDYCQHFGEDGQRLDVNINQQPATDASPESSDDDPATFITEKGNRTTGSLTPSVTMQSDGRSVTFQAPTVAHGEARLFQFDANLTETCDQETVYNQVAQPIVEDVMAGYNGTILAYGQTATGKTHTMVGPGDLVHGDQRGLIPRALEDIFDQAEKTRSRVKTTIAISYVQIYCERIFDLLEPETSPSNILVREDADRGVYLDGAAAVYVANVEDCLNLMERGNTNRAVSSTEMNAHSSRSHAILILRVERKEFASTSSNQPVIRLSNLYLVDLAGSERVKKAKVYGRHISELKAINLSLSALGNCISALSKQSQQSQTSYHVPYRDSKLTRLLQSSLGGNAKTALVVTITPAVTEAPETLQTLQFGQRAMQVAVRAHRSALSVLDYRTLYEEMRQALDEEQQRSHEAEATASDEKNRAAIAEDKLTKAMLRVQHLEFELEAAQTATRHSTSGDSEENDVDRMKMELQQLVARHAQDVTQVKSACDRQIDTYKRLAHEASQEWHEVEGELAGEKTQVLHTLQELKEFKLRFFQLEEETTERIAELVQDERDRERERDAALARVTALEKELKAIHAKMVDGESQREKLQDQIETEFVPKEAIQQMEALYEGAISKLQARVGCLENKSLSRRPKTPSNNSNNNAAPGPKRSLPDVRKPGMVNRAVPRVGRLVPGAKSGSSSRLNTGQSVASRILQ